LDEAAATETPGAGPTASPVAGEDPIGATTTAWAAGTATAAAGEAAPEATEEEPMDTAEATTAAEPTEPSATDTPEPEPTDTAEAAEPTATSEAGASTGSGEARTHIVQPGENLFRIALAYGMSYESVANYNGITNPNLVYVGQEIKIPPADSETPSPPQTGDGQATSHVVQPGENLYRIALQYGMMYTTLAQANNLDYPYTVYVGQRLVIPSQ
jgi:LysM repeat protein